MIMKSGYTGLVILFSNCQNNLFCGCYRRVGSAMLTVSLLRMKQILSWPFLTGGQAIRYITSSKIILVDKLGKKN
jgi:hypothetical protein